MKKIFVIALAAAAMLSSCGNDDKTTWDEYAEWREANNAWMAEMQAKKNADGTPYYTTVVPEWNPGTYVLIHYLTDRAETEGNLSPIYTSTVDTRYTLYLYDGTPADSSDLLTSNGPGVYRTKLNAVVQGWAIALPEMRCGDSAEVIVPYSAGYGSSSIGDIKPYSALHFHIRLVDIPYYEKPPYTK